jgi:hypothetical protein
LPDPAGVGKASEADLMNRKAASGSGP